jgi:hypothetical protein
MLLPDLMCCCLEYVTSNDKPRIVAYSRVVPRAFWVCAQSAVLSQCSALSVSEKAHLLLFWLAELRPRRKTVKNIALGKETAGYSNFKGKHAEQTQPCASSQCLEAFVRSISACAKRNNVD